MAAPARGGQVEAQASLAALLVGWGPHCTASVAVSVLFIHRPEAEGVRDDARVTDIAPCPRPHLHHREVTSHALESWVAMGRPPTVLLVDTPGDQSSLLSTMLTGMGRTPLEEE